MGTISKPFIKFIITKNKEMISLHFTKLGMSKEYLHLGITTFTIAKEISSTFNTVHKQRVQMRVMIAFLVRDRVKVRVVVTFNVSVIIGAIVAGANVVHS